jgi:hypothetical protein
VYNNKCSKFFRIKILHQLLRVSVSLIHQKEERRCTRKSLKHFTTSSVYKNSFENPLLNANSYPCQKINLKFLERVKLALVLISYHFTHALSESRLHTISFWNSLLPGFSNLPIVSLPFRTQNVSAGVNWCWKTTPSFSYSTWDTREICNKYKQMTKECQKYTGRHRMLFHRCSGNCTSLS